ncbi:MAG TPA: RecQ family ATP-dependent DNA helicase, partial [Calditrichaeota bacterium]|nr:RecQ family ATP-dependent DNA helicase [Calditrichota bacterium]
AIISANSDEGFSADQLAEMTPFAKAKDDPDKETESQRVIRSLHDMKTAGLLSESMLLTAFVNYKMKGSSLSMIKKIVDLENKILGKLQEEAPDVDTDDEKQWQNLSISRLNQYLLDVGLTDSNPERIQNILHGLSQDGKGMASNKGSLEIRHFGRDQYRIHIKRGWLALRTTAQLRQAVAHIVLKTIINKIQSDSPANASLLVEFSLDDLSNALKQDSVLCSQLKDPLAVIDRALLYLHEQKIIILQNGLAIFRQAMTIKVLPEKRGYTNKDYKPLSHHYEERVFQVHVMNEYARIGLDKISAALEFVLAYFAEDKDSFIQRYFPRKKGMLERATSQQSYQKIVSELGNKKQETIVEASDHQNSLILAGPGSGKTRTVVHRCAWLLRVKRIPAEGILVLTFNRNAATLLRRRLYTLVDRDAYGVTIQTYHSLALRLTGYSFYHEQGMKKKGEDTEPDFDAVIREAIALLKGETEILGIEPDNIRDRLLAGYRQILVDEYQDIDELQYEL